MSPWQWKALQNFSLIKFLQGIFFIVVSVGTVYNAYFMLEQSRAINKPVIGVHEIKTYRHMINPDQGQSYDNVKGVSIFFIFKNTGRLGASDFKPILKMKIGNIIQPRVDTEYRQGTYLLQDGTASLKKTINKGSLDKILSGEKCICSIELKYSDWDRKHSYEYSTDYEVKIVNKAPLNLSLQPY